MEIRSVKGSDYYVISPLINEWWGGRNMSDKLPKLFFDHFAQTSFIAEKDGKLVGFLIGFLSQTHSNEAYIHFVGVHPEYRKHNIGKHLYNKFFNVVKHNNRSIVRCVTSPVNKVSIAYHTKLGFEIEDGDRIIEGLSLNTDYDGPNQDRVLFVKKLD
ncbi:GNAT family N-acetyltransferase [Lysinibacillus pakistanensis]|uniref:GNAT family N-acetyltransferase n=1 Tax=Lysinibacillus pakistanensis TaxID=759811 RepID=A0AAX3X3R6_9BACI|nr:GNAT family N-acetyltransferase [Lysinibacillus pakistanensis]MDM5233546.1 GNAT family N-acetyltransferase [Lysinibacillus pakistanensis]WHY49016.1 GNAT family N-acetyltransferase [Lysinibacillus pakistanensis]WHY54027.1 GNAT family N-acetyltransferase [Lysinibacillus pakistanensis]